MSDAHNEDDIDTGDEDAPAGLQQRREDDGEDDEEDDETAGEE